MGFPVEEHEPAPDVYAIEPLTRREKEILELLAAGLSNREIADELVVSLNTVKWYARQIYDKLGVSNRKEAARRARARGLLGAAGERHNLPAPLTSFVGREAEQAEISRLIAAPDCHLLTLAGLGGIGKTRLAIQATAHLTEERPDLFPDGVCFVALTSLTDPDAIPDAIADALRLTLDEREGGLKAGLIEHLRGKRLLLVLDNFEHLVEGAGVVRDILAAAPGVKALVTSREPLRMQAERIFQVHGLGFPGEGIDDDFESYPAVALFLERARHTRPDLVPGDNEKESIARICQLAQGMPLALELAAAWVSALSCAEIASEIKGNLDILAASLRDVPERQRSIRAVFDHSWSLLGEKERGALMGLSVFSGGFTREAAEDVTDASLAALSGLVNKSLVRRDAAGRYQMHELIRQFGEEKLAAAGGAEEIRDRHTAHYAALMDRLEVDLKGADQAGALRRIASDLDNIRAAWNWAIEQRDHEAIDQLVESLYLYCTFRRGAVGGSKLLVVAQERLAGSADPAIRRVWARVKARYEMLNIDVLRAARPGSLDEVGEQIKACLEVALQSEEGAEVLFCRYALGRAEMWAANLSKAVDILEDALAYAEAIGDRFHQAFIRYRLGFCFFLQGELERSAEHCEQGLKIARSSGNLYVAAWPLVNLAAVLVALNRLEDADSCLDEALALFEELGDRQGAAWSTAFQALNRLRLRDFEEARRLSQAAIDMSREVSHQTTTAQALAIHGWVLIGHGEREAARQCAEESLRLSSANVNPGYAWFVLAYTACFEGDIPTVRAYLRDVVQEWNGRGFDNQIVNCLPILGMTLAREGQHEAAAELLALALAHPLRLSGWLDKDPLVAELTDRLREALDDETYAAALERGRQLDFDTVVQQVLREEI